MDGQIRQGNSVRQTSYIVVQGDDVEEEAPAVPGSSAKLGSSNRDRLSQRKSSAASESEHATPCNNDSERFALLDRALSAIEEESCKFRWAMIFLIGLGYFIEASEMAILGLLFPQFIKDFGVEEEDLAIIQSMSAVGMTVGVLFYGRLSDTRGRRWVLRQALTISLVAGFASSFANSVTTFAVARLVLGIGYGGALINSSPLLLESIAPECRSASSGKLPFFWGAGSTFTIVLSWAIMDSLGWAAVVRILALVSLPAIIMLALLIPESPRFLVATGDYQGAVESLAQMAKFNQKGNGAPRFFTVENLVGRQDYDQGVTSQAQDTQVVNSSSQSTCARYRPLMKRQLILGTLLPLMTIWFFNSFGSAIGSFYPVALEEARASLPAENAKHADSDDSGVAYQVATAFQVGDWIGAFVVATVGHRLPRIMEMRLGLLGQAAASLAIGATANSSMFLLVPSLMVLRVSLQLTFHALYTYSPESFATKVRVAGFSLCQLVHRCAPIVSPYVATILLQEQGVPLTCAVFAGITATAVLATFFLSRETASSSMVEEEPQVPIILRTLSRNRSSHGSNGNGHDRIHNVNLRKRPSSSKSFVEIELAPSSRGS